MVCKIVDELIPEETESLKDYFRRQYSDGWGEGVEQREIEIYPNAEMFVKFHGDDYYMRTEQEQIEFENSQQQEQNLNIA